MNTAKAAAQLLLLVFVCSSSTTTTGTAQRVCVPNACGTDLWSLVLVPVFNDTTALQERNMTVISERQQKLCLRHSAFNRRLCNSPTVTLAFVCVDPPVEWICAAASSMLVFSSGPLGDCQAFIVRWPLPATETDIDRRCNEHTQMYVDPSLLARGSVNPVVILSTCVLVLLLVGVSVSLWRSHHS